MNVSDFQSFLKNNKKNLVFVLLILSGLCMVLFSGEKSSKETESISPRFDEESYEEALESRLKKIVEEIDGVGDVSVMVTLEGSAIYSYATDVSQDVGKEGGSKKESTVVLSTKASSVKEAVISGYTLPRVKGAAVVCSSNLSATLRSKVIGVVSAALGISSAKICVTN